MKIKKNIKKAGIGLLVSAIAISGAFAWLTNSDTAQKSNQLKIGTIKIVFDNQLDSISLVDNSAIPMTKDNAIANLTAYTFDIKNEGEIHLDYTISIDGDNYLNTFDTEKIKVLIAPITDDATNDDIKTALNSASIQSLSSNLSLVSSNLQSGKHQKYALLAYIDSSTILNEYKDKSVSFKLKVQATQKTESSLASERYNNLQKSSIATSITTEGGESKAVEVYNIEGESKDLLLESLVESKIIEASEVDAIVEVCGDDYDGMNTSATFNVSSIANPGDTVVILHYNEETNEWEYIGKEVVGEDNTVTGNFTSYSPVVFIVNTPDGGYWTVEYFEDGRKIEHYRNVQNQLTTIRIEYPDYLEIQSVEVGTHNVIQAKYIYNEEDEKNYSVRNYENNKIIYQYTLNKDETYNIITYQYYESGNRKSEMIENYNADGIITGTQETILNEDGSHNKVQHEDYENGSLSQRISYYYLNTLTNTTRTYFNNNIPTHEYEDYYDGTNIFRTFDENGLITSEDEQASVEIPETIEYNKTLSDEEISIMSQNFGSPKINKLTSIKINDNEIINTPNIKIDTKRGVVKIALNDESLSGILVSGTNNCNFTFNEKEYSFTFEKNIKNVVSINDVKAGDNIILDGGNYKVLTISDGIAKVITTEPYKTTIARVESTGEEYKNSKLDLTMIEYYNSLSADMQNAIISQNITQTVASFDTFSVPEAYDTYILMSQSGTYHFGENDTKEEYTFIREQNTYDVGERKVYALDVTDIRDALGNNITPQALNDFIFGEKNYVEHRIWLRTTVDLNAGYQGAINGYLGNIDIWTAAMEAEVYPAFVIDLSKIDIYK